MHHDRYLPPTHSRTQVLVTVWLQLDPRFRLLIGIPATRDSCSSVHHHVPQSSRLPLRPLSLSGPSCRMNAGFFIAVSVFLLFCSPCPLPPPQITASAMDVCATDWNQIASGHSGGQESCSAPRVANPTWVVCSLKLSCSTESRSIKPSW